MHDRTTIPPHPCQSQLLDFMLGATGSKNDAALARKLELAPPLLSKLRNGRLPVTAATLLILHDKTGMSIAEIRSLVTPAAAEQ